MNEPFVREGALIWSNDEWGAQWWEIDGAELDGLLREWLQPGYRPAVWRQDFGPFRITLERIGKEGEG